MRVGIGYDVHRLAAGRPLILGGVRVPHNLGLFGHSDADVLAHAVIDALLGAAGLGDIGGHFPDTDPAYAGADSMELLRRAAAELAAAGWRVVNLDAVIIAERPKLAPHAAAIRNGLAAAIGTSAGTVSVKGKTNEGLGELGRGEAIAVMAVALIARSSSRADRKP